MGNRTLSNIFKGDKTIWMVFFFLCIISIVEVYTASSQLTYRAGSNFMAPIMKHVFIMGLGWLFMICISLIPCRYYKIVNLPLMGLSIALLIIVFIIGQATNGAQRWIPVLGMQFQPSEIAKGAWVLWTAQILSNTQTEQGADKRAFIYVLIPGFAIVPLILSENLSTAALLCVVIFLMMIIARVPGSQLGKLLSGVILAVAAFIAFVLLAGDAPQQDKNVPAVYTQSTNQVATNDDKAKTEKRGFMGRVGTWKGRILRFTDKKDLSPKDVDLRDKGAQSAHADIAIATSKIFGKGPGNSDECDFLSQAYSDFIFAIIIEELGIEGAMIVVALYIILLFRVGYIAKRCENNFPALLAMGLTMLIVVQAMFNMCVAVGLFPVTGQPLPFISKGGTSTIVNCAYLGAILSISRTAKKKNRPENTATPASQVAVA